LRLEATLAYIDLHRFQQLDALVVGFQDELRGFEEAAAVRYEVGTGTQEAVLKAQLEKHTLAQQRLDLQRQQRSAVETLARLTNVPGGTRFYQSAALAAPPVPEVAVAELALLAAATRPEAEALAGAAARAVREVEL